MKLSRIKKPMAQRGGGMPLAVARTRPPIAAAAVAAGALFWWVLLKNAWLCEDFFIIARQIEQLFAGNGLRWNPHERAQLFTSVLAFFLRVGVRVFTDDYFIINAVLAVVFNTAMLVLLWRLLPPPTALRWLAAVCLLAASNTFIVHSWYGLNNNIGHTILIAFLIFYHRLWTTIATGKNKKRRNTVAIAATQHGDLIALFAVASLAPLFRHDFILLIWTPVLFVLWSLRQTQSRTKLCVYFAVLTAPIALWSLFSLFYFGFPLPLSAYFKFAGIGLSNALANGFHYYQFVLKHDTPILFLIAFALWRLVVHGQAPQRALAVGLFLNLFYILYSGADYMSGRFFTYGYLLAVVIIVSLPNKKLSAVRPYAILSGAALTWMVLVPHTPLKQPYPDGDIIGRGIIKEHNLYSPGSNIAAYLAYRRGETAYYPNNLLVRLGKNYIADINPDVVAVHFCNAGMLPYSSGRLDLRMIEINGYTDPLAARLPAQNYAPGHFLRILPHGYLDSVATDTAALEDEKMNEYYKRLRRVTQDGLNFSAQRWADIWHINFNAPPVPESGKPSGELPLFNNQTPHKHWPFLCKKAEIENQKIQLGGYTRAQLNRSDLVF